MIRLTNHRAIEAGFFLIISFIGLGFLPAQAVAPTVVGVTDASVGATPTDVGVTETLPALELTLPRTLELVLAQNRDVLSSKQDVSKADAQIREAWSYALPQIGVSGTYLRNAIPTVMIFNDKPITTTLDNSYSFSASLAQPLWSRKVGLALDIAKTYKEFFDKAREATEEATVREATKAYYRVLLAKKLVDVNREGLSVVMANRDNVRALYQNGAAAEYDMLRAEVQLANTEPAITSAENNYELAKDALKNLLAIPLDREIALQGDLEFADVPTEEVATANAKAVETNSGLMQLRLQESMLEKNTAVEKANYYPSLYLIGAYGWQTQDNSFSVGKYRWQNSLALGLTMSFTPFDGFRTAAKIQEASIDQRKIQLTRIKAEEGLQLMIQTAANQMAEAKKRIQAQSKSLEQAEKALQIAQTRYQNGISTQLELLDTQVAMTKSQTIYAQAIYDFLTAKADWQYYVGNLR
jgi:outer membrane protein